MMKVARIATRLALFLNFSPHFAVAHASFLLSSFFSRVCIAPPKGRTSSVSSVIHPSHQSGDGDRLDQTRACLPSSFSTKHDVLTAFFIAHQNRLCNACGIRWAKKAKIAKEQGLPVPVTLHSKKWRSPSSSEELPKIPAPVVAVTMTTPTPSAAQDAAELKPSPSTLLLKLIRRMVAQNAEDGKRL